MGEVGGSRCAVWGPVAQGTLTAMAVDEAAEAAAQAGLRYVNDNDPGIRRVRRGRGFSYVRPDGALVRDEGERARIQAIAIPPAWSEVWICPRPDGHILATGRDARGRKQYRCLRGRLLRWFGERSDPLGKVLSDGWHVEVPDGSFHRQVDEVGVVRVEEQSVEAVERHGCQKGGALVAIDEGVVRGD